MDPSKINSQTLAAVQRMIKDGNVSASEARRHAANLNKITVRKRGDAQRILLMNMVKDGNISLAIANRSRDGRTELWVVDTVKGVGAVIDHRMTGSGHVFDETLFEGEAGMVGSEGNGGHESRVYDLCRYRPGEMRSGAPARPGIT